ncbi:MAG: hypothetical protein HUJ31_11410 [Pseudomonadales bacterium]|nr:hypothetical protein [Pseudomonadales bacterium]
MRRWKRAATLRLMVTFVLGFSVNTVVSAASDVSDELRLFKNLDMIPAMLEQGTLTADELPSPHWRGDACNACHTGSQDGESYELRFDIVDESCHVCHDSDRHAAIHPVDLIPSEKIRSNMSSGFADTLTSDGGRMNCVTCHNARMQCSTNRFYRAEYFPNFIRDWPYSNRTGLCYKCHVASNYRPLVPHDQIADDGTVAENKCLLCHKQVPEQLEDGTAINTELLVSHDMKAVCVNCHLNRPHPSGNNIFNSGEVPNHLVPPPQKILDRMMLKSREANVVFPLDKNDGRIYCATCHNPHDEGILKTERSAKGAGEEYFLRTKQIGRNCHDK